MMCVMAWRLFGSLQCDSVVACDNACDSVSVGVTVCDPH